MTRALHQLAIPAALCAGLLGSCTTHGGNTFVVTTKIVQPTGTLDAVTKVVTNCVIDPGSPELNFPAFNTTVPLQLGIVLQNRLIAGSTPTRPQSNDFVAEKVVINYESTNTGTPGVPEQNLPAQGFVPAGGSAAISAVLIPAGAIATALTALPSVRVHLYVVGRLGDGSTVKTSDYEFIAVPGAATTGCVGK